MLKRTVVANAEKTTWSKSRKEYLGAGARAEKARAQQPLARAYARYYSSQVLPGLLFSAFAKIVFQHWPQSFMSALASLFIGFSSNYYFQLPCTNLNDPNNINSSRLHARSLCEGRWKCTARS